MGHVILVSSRHRIVLGMCLELLPGAADRSEFTLAVVIHMTHIPYSMEKHVVATVACPFGYIQLEFMRTSLR